ncbi:hypothetical protein D770_16495 [Flammeovirgaceae bacterium 311]|nr:hypothetical protein D770_16495 [Flammeovirgaceae bacterium 311]
MLNALKPIICTTFLVLAVSLQLLAQKEAAPFTAKNAVYLELGGNGVFYSLNYERMVYQKGMFKSAARIGFSTFPKKIETETKTYWNAALPLELLGLIGRSKHHLEFGVGYTPYYYADTKFEVGSRGFEFDRYRFTAIVPFRIGYRYQNPDGGFLFRVGYMPTMDFHPDRHQPWNLVYGGISIGKSF